MQGHILGTTVDALGVMANDCCLFYRGVSFICEASLNYGLKFYVRSSLEVVHFRLLNPCFAPNLHPASFWRFGTLIRPYPDECHQLFVQIEAYATFIKTHN